MVKKEMVYEVLLKDLNRLWMAAKNAATLWKQSPTIRFEVLVIPISATIRTAITNITQNVRKLDKTETQAATTLNQIKTRLRTLQEEVSKTGEDQPIVSPTILISVFTTAVGSMVEQILKDYALARKSTIARELAITI